MASNHSILIMAFSPSTARWTIVLSPCTAVSLVSHDNHSAIHPLITGFSCENPLTPPPPPTAASQQPVVKIIIIIGKCGNEKSETRLLNWLEHTERSNQNPRGPIPVFRSFFIFYRRLDFNDDTNVFHSIASARHSEPSTQIPATI